MSYKFSIDVTVRRKLGLMERRMPVESVIDFGGMWEVDGYYSKQCLTRFGAKRVTMVDMDESDNWKDNPTLREGIDFRRGDFSDERFMKSIAGSFDLALALDVLVHQIDLRRTLSLMLSKTRCFFLISNPVIPDSIMPYRNSLVLLSGSHSLSLIPFHAQWTKGIDYWRNFMDASDIDRHHFLWGMSPSFIESLMVGLGWGLIHREVWKDRSLQNPKWRMGGFVFTKRPMKETGSGRGRT